MVRIFLNEKINGKGISAMKIKVIKMVLLTAISIMLGLFSIPTVIAFADITNEIVTEQYSAETNLVNEPTVVTEVESIAHFNEILTSDRKPSNIIFSVSGEKAASKDGAILGDFFDVLNSLNLKVLPIIRVESIVEVSAFLSLMAERQVLDIAVASSNAELIKAVKSDGNCGHVRGIWYVNKTEDLYSVVRTAQKMAH